MSHATNTPGDPADTTVGTTADSVAEPTADETVGRLSGYTTGIDLMRVPVGDIPTYDFDDHALVGLPMIVACTYCTTTMAGAAALIDSAGSCWCADCAELRGDPDV